MYARTTGVTDSPLAWTGGMMITYDATYQHNNLVANGPENDLDIDKVLEITKTKQASIRNPRWTIPPHSV